MVMLSFSRAIVYALDASINVNIAWKIYVQHQQPHQPNKSQCVNMYLD